MGTGCSSDNNVIRASTASLQDNETTPFKVLILGPSNAGKTYLLYSWLLEVEGVHSTKPTEEFNVETLESKSGVRFTVWDLSGALRHHRKRKFYEGTQGLVFVYNANTDLTQAKDDFQLLLEERVVQDVPLMIVANQMKEHETPSEEDLLGNLGVKKDMLNRRWCLSRVRLKSQQDVHEAICDLQRLVKK
ncbi:ADP-ribosylation factor-like protein 11 [Haliotis rufescens]|uniref:ADP-ribosylation factor-like protein 11 n=1 Tax=Haliotis rufescens TaxID=6454 RepID=UPI00201EB5E3|nr:ADP-ribosylation factor-like protein 11 [Haliotis rufescens]